MTDDAGFMMTNVAAEVTVDGIVHCSLSSMRTDQIVSLQSVGVDMVASMRERLPGILVGQLRDRGITADPGLVTVSVAEQWLDLSDVVDED